MKYIFLNLKRFDVPVEYGAGPAVGLGQGRRGGRAGGACAV